MTWERLIIFLKRKKEINKNDALNDLYNNKNILLKKYFNSLFTVISKIKHESPASIVDMQEIPKNWKIQKSYYDNLMLNIQKDNEIVDKYVVQKRILILIHCLVI